VSAMSAWRSARRSSLCRPGDRKESRAAEQVDEADEVRAWPGRARPSLIRVFDGLVRVGSVSSQPCLLTRGGYQ
jgi:hypothetical protein